MNKRKLTLGLAGALVAVSGMAACNEVTYKEGVILTYTDGTGTKIDYKAEDLFADYLPTSSSASTIFNTVRKVLIRNYFNQAGHEEALAACKKTAAIAVQTIRETAQNNANSNGTTYGEEISKLLSSEGVENIDELTEKKLYEAENDAFENEYYTTESYNAIRDGTRWTEDGASSMNLNTEDLVEKYGPVSEGYLKERMPYHVSHILVKLASASNNEHTQDKISEAESKKLSAVVKEIAGATNDADGVTESTVRLGFGSIALDLSEDDGSAKNYGDLGIMDKKTGFVQEFKLGVYAYEALYNKKNAADEARTRLLPSAEDESVDADAIINAFKDRKIGTIPYGAFVALGKTDVAKNPDLGHRVNENSDLYFPRNILFNKYMNNHQIAVITPNEIPFNDANRDGAWDGATDGSGANTFADIYALETDANGDPITTGVPSDAYKALPGFKTDTTDIVDAGGSNVLTNEKGQIVLAVRAGASSYQGIHFIVVDRSPLTQYASYNATTGAFEEITEADYNTGKSRKDVTSLSEYYTMREDPTKLPANDNAATTNPDGYFPFYKNDAGAYAAKSTFVNKLNTSTSDYDAQADKVREAVKGVVTDNNTYMFEELMVSGKLTFNTTALGKQIEELVTSYIKSTRTNAPVESMESFDKDWKTYMEYLDQQDVERKMKEDGSQELISEVCAIGYGSRDAWHGTGLWGKGGACYDGK